MLNEIAKKCLDYGFLLRLFYQDEKSGKLKYCCVIKGDWFNKLNVIENKVSKNCVYNICLDKSLNLSEIIVSQIDYVNAPSGIDVHDITSPSAAFKKLGKDFMSKSAEYMSELKTNVIKLKLNYNDFLKENFLLEEQEFNSDAKDLCLLKFYPKVKKITKKDFNHFKKQLIEEFFTIKRDNETTQFQQKIPALEMFGISEDLLLCKDSLLIDALKRQWNKLIEQNKNEFLTKINDIDKTVFEPDELEEFEAEAQALKKEIERTTFNSLSNLQDVKSIISFWPEILQPNPYFVYAGTD